MTTDTPQTNFDSVMNYCYADEMVAKLRWADGEESVPLNDYTAKCCCEKGCKTDGEEILENGLECDCPIAIMYYLGTQAAENRAHLKKYEDILYDESGNERISVDRLKEVAEADGAGRCVVLPCKVGDDAWYLDLNTMDIHKLRIQGISVNYNGLPVFHLGDWVAVSIKQLGQVWFLTSEAAEAAIEARL
jgi:hypothetical protein